MNNKLEKLNRIFYLDKEINRLKNRIEELSILSSTSMDKEITSGGGVSDAVSKYALKKIELLELLNKSLEKRIDEEIKVRKFMDSIDDVEMRSIIELRFILKKTWDEIASELSPDDKYIHRTTFIKKFNRFIQNSHISLYDVL